jgi:hypothetical protein
MHRIKVVVWSDYFNLLADNEITSQLSEPLSTSLAGERKPLDHKQLLNMSFKDIYILCSIIVVGFDPTYFNGLHISF